MSTGENEQDLRKIVDMTRLASICLLFLHFYYYCYAFFESLGIYADFTNRIMIGISGSGLFKSPVYSKGLALLTLMISLFGTTGKKQKKTSQKNDLILLGIGLVFYCLSLPILKLEGNINTIALVYFLISTLGFLMILAAAIRLKRHLSLLHDQDIFNERNETFPQEERLLTNEHSINLDAIYTFREQSRSSYINIINPYRGILVTGSPGAGKSWFIILPMIKQFIEKGFGMFIYDFKYDDLSKAAYNWLLNSASNNGLLPEFYAINFDDLNCSHRCNPLDPDSMTDITEASESARSILLGLNRDWIKKQGDFFVESAINFVTAIIWFLKKYEDGRYCTLPHAIELMQCEYEDLLPVLNGEPEVSVYINDFIKAYQDNSTDQLSGQVASAKVGIARLSSPPLYWVLSGNDFTLDINNPIKPKIVCVGNNPAKQQIYGAVLSLYVSRLIKIINRKGQQKCAVVFDEYPTIFFNNMDTLIATARSNKVATVLAMQDFSQLKKEYGKDQADVIMNICGNFISGQVSGETGKSLSERFGKIMQDRESHTVNRQDTSVSFSQQLETAIPPSKIVSLSAGQFVGMVSDNPEEKIKLKAFHASIVKDSVRANNEISAFKPIPAVYEITQQDIMDNYFQIKYDIKNLIEKEVEKLLLEKNDDTGR